MQQLSADYCLPPFSNYKQLNQTGPRIIERAEGVFVFDNKGNRLLDGMAGLWCVNLGYGRDELVEAAAAQMRQLPYYNLFFQSTHPPAMALSQKLAELCPGDLNRAFFTGSGSECNDTVVRMARHYWTSKGHPDKQVIISRHNAYHGSTMAGASLGGMDFMHAQGGLPLPNIEHIDQPYWFGEGQGQDPHSFGLERAAQLEQKILELGEDKVAAFIAEPIQGAGGVIIPPDSYWPEIQRICDKYQILLVADEVICGFGRTGNWFASQTFNINPDLMCLAKGITSGYLPLGAVMVSDEVAQVLIDADTEFAHGFTYSGHPAACAVALKNIELLESEGHVARVGEQLAPYLAEQWAKLAEHPLVGEARSCGFVAALELVANKQTMGRFAKSRQAGVVCRDICIGNGIIMRACGDTMIISPPLVMTIEEIDLMLTLIHRSLDQTASALGVK
ncbi:aspartate aminotransferase family protein [Aliagarivorans marinus]|uniref:aspartate aminotransferase family protein n=1 Tax=Aliagarivorans marinus TaxID=561965 RepID=UPI0003FE3DF4|nr:aspartate aminotransferase family protein [Aliagarivorans marinus]